MRVLITRPQADAEPLAAMVTARGHEPVVAPVMKIELSQAPPPAAIAKAVLLFTSANGVRAAREQGVAGNSVYAVGAASAEAARAAGYRIAGTGAGNVASLAELVAARAQPGELLVHVTGADRAGDLQADLAARGFATESWIAYRAVGVEKLPSAARRFMQGEAGGVLLFSPRSASLFLALLDQAGLSAEASRHSALCLSAAVAEAAGGLSWRERRSAATPDAPALLDLIR